MQRSKAFTLIELLVVIAIIAILAAILFPVFAQAKAAAKKTVALSNAKQVATANLLYMGDNDDALIKEFFGFPGDCSSWGNTYYNWRHAMNPYTKSVDLLSDPTNPFKEKAYWTESYTDGNPANREVLPQNFAVNNHVIGFANGRCAGPYTPEGLSSLNTLDDVAGTILIVPNRSQWNDLKISFISQAAEPQSNGWCIPQGTGSICPAATNGAIHAVSKGSSFIWADGHAKFVNVLSTAKTNEVNFDNWYAYGSNNPATGVKYTQVERQNYVANAFPEYK
ncbi:prepilin-type N-terminal cleavage/methylation domain-containing protein [bacterium]|nr:MAG: prepilin-type N-terminal cleavage/methylation domain-containing protein [bacterium]